MASVQALSMVKPEQMVGNTIRIEVSEKIFDGNLKFVSKIAEGAKNKGKSVFFRKTGNKLIMCSGGIKSSVAMVCVDINGDAGEIKGFVDGKDIIKKLSKRRSKDDRLELIFDKSKSCIFFKHDNLNLARSFDIIEDGVAAEDADSVIAKYRNEVVERAYRIVRDVASKGRVQLKYKDFLDLEKAFTHTVYKVGGEKYVDFRVFKEIQKVKTKVKDPSDGIEKEVWVNKEFPIVEGIGFNDNSMGKCRKYGLGVGLPVGANEIRMVIESDLLNNVSSAIAVMKEEPVEISRGADEMCISSGNARFIFPVKDIPVYDIRPYFAIECGWKITVNAPELRSVIELLSDCLDQGLTANQVPPLNKMIVKPGIKKIIFSGIGTDNLPVECDIEYKMAIDDNGNEYRDLQTNEIPLDLHRKYIREFLDSCSSKEVSLGIHTYMAKRKKLDENRMFVKDAQGNVVEEEYQGRLISMEDSERGMYGVHQRVKL